MFRTHKHCTCVCVRALRVHACDGDAKGIYYTRAPPITLSPPYARHTAPANIHGRPTLIPHRRSVLVHRDRTRLSVNHCHLFIHTHARTPALVYVINVYMYACTHCAYTYECAIIDYDDNSKYSYTKTNGFRQKLGTTRLVVVRKTTSVAASAAAPKLSEAI